VKKETEKTRTHSAHPIGEGGCTYGGALSGRRVLAGVLKQQWACGGVGSSPSPPPCPHMTVSKTDRKAVAHTPQRRNRRRGRHTTRVGGTRRGGWGWRHRGGDTQRCTHPFKRMIVSCRHPPLTPSPDWPPAGSQQPRTSVGAADFIHFHNKTKSPIIHRLCDTRDGVVGKWIPRGKDKTERKRSMRFLRGERGGALIGHKGGAVVGALTVSVGSARFVSVL
jgi:hypothetical protein